jgi:actin-like ATPase involved in cell morphogenesis
MKREEYKLPYRIDKPEEYEEKEKEESKVVKVYKHEPYKPKEIKVEKRKVQKVSIPLLQRMIKDMQPESSMQLPKIGAEVIGDIFDRVKFLKSRIEELERAIRAREEMNARFNQEIEKDVEELEKVLSTISDREEMREFKLNITLLRMEKRKENINFWKDIVELRSQLKELIEEYESEMKIANIFSSLKGGI